MSTATKFEGWVAPLIELQWCSDLAHEEEALDASERNIADPIMDAAVDRVVATIEAVPETRRIQDAIRELGPVSE